MINHGIFHGSTKKTMQPTKLIRVNHVKELFKVLLIDILGEKPGWSPLVTSSGFNHQKRTTICEVIVPKPWVFFFICFCLTNGQSAKLGFLTFFLGLVHT